MKTATLEGSGCIATGSWNANIQQYFLQFIFAWSIFSKSEKKKLQQKKIFECKKYAQK